VGRYVALLSVVLVLLLAGCGDDDDGGDGGSTSPAQTAQTETTQPTTEATTTEESGGGGPAPDKAQLESCLADADLELKAGDEPFKDEEGQTKTRKGMNLDDATYLGYVQWPSKRVADIYVSKDEAAAQKSEQEAGLFVKAFGFDPAKYVKRSGAVVLTFDDPPPSAEETKAVEDCAAGG
jgi:hypothetical protein